MTAPGLMALTLVALVVLVHLALRYNVGVAIAVGLLVSSTILPLTLWGYSSAHPGVTTASPVAHTYSLLVAAGSLAALNRFRRIRPFAPILFVLLSGIWALLFWGSATIVVAGLLHYSAAALAWIVVAPLADLDVRTRDRLVMTIIMAVVLVEAAVVAIQAAGFVLPIFGGTISAGGYARATGTLGHPGTLGKVMTLLLLLALPSTNSGDKNTRRMAWAVVILAALITGMTLGRANILALVATLLLWFLLDPTRRLGGRIRIGVLVLLIVSPFITSVLGRFDDDPTGGARPQLEAEALNQIGHALFLGTGPNTYVEVVGATGSFTGAGFPVHNAFLLLLAELGLPLALLFLWPFIAATSIGVRQLSRRVPDDAFARALLVAIPGTLITAVTGWGLLQGPMLYLWVAVYGYLYACATSRRSEQSNVLSGKAVSTVAVRAKTRRN